MMQEAAFALQEGSLTILHREPTLPAGEESDSDFEHLEFDPYNDIEPEDVSSGHKFESTIRDSGRPFEESLHPTSRSFNCRSSRQPPPRRLLTLQESVRRITSPSGRMNGHLGSAYLLAGTSVR